MDTFEYGFMLHRWWEQGGVKRVTLSFTTSDGSIELGTVDTVEGLGLTPSSRASDQQVAAAINRLGRQGWEMVSYSDKEDCMAFKRKTTTTSPNRRSALATPVDVEGDES